MERIFSAPLNLFIMDPFTISALIGAGSSLVSGLLSNKAAKSAQERSISAQRSLQQMLMTGGAQMARNAKQAGLSPAFALGQSSTPAASAPASNFAPFDFSSLGDIASKRELLNLQKEQKEVAKAETDKTKAEANIAKEKAKQEEINTKDLQARRRVFVPQSSSVDENGNLVVSTSPYAGEYGEQLGNIDLLELGLKKSGIDLQNLSNEVDKAVKEKQKSDDKILSAMAHLPKDTQDNIRSQAESFLAAAKSNNADAALKQAQELYVNMQREFLAMQKNEFATGSVDNLFDNMSFENFFKWLLKQITLMVRGNVNIHN